MSAVDTSATKENDSIVVNSNCKIEPTNADKKEEETTQQNPISKSDKNTNKPTVPNTPSAEELLTKAKQFMNEDKYSQASNLLSNAMQIIQTNNSAKALSIESVKYYMAYGESLLRFIQSSNDLFADPVRQSQQKHIEEQETEVPTLITNATENDKTENQTETKPNKDTQNSKEENDEDFDMKPQTETNNKELDIDTSEDREIAWETLEYARTILEDYLSKNEGTQTHKKTLGQCHSLLGELLIEDENNENALLEFEEALKCYNKCENGTIECRQIAFDRFMACLAAQFCGKNECALQHCNSALNEISKRIRVLVKEVCSVTLDGIECKESDSDSEMYTAFVSATESAIASMDSAQKESAKGKELCVLMGSMTDLMCKLEEVKDNMKKGVDIGRNTASDKNEGLVSDDPLSALINGLTNRFGINEEQMKEMEKIDLEKNGNKNVNKSESEGVTTIGFGNGNTEVSEVNELGSFGVQTKSKRKRTLNEAGISEDGNEEKKVKLNSGNAAVAEQK